MPAPPSNSSHAPARILLIDDEPMICDVLQLVLEREGYEVVAVGSCGEARAKMQGGRFSAALIDKNLPDGNGVELCAEMRALLPDTALLIMTGYTSFDTAVQSMRLGASDYLAKPFHSLDEVVMRIAKAIEDRTTERERMRVEAELRAGITSARNELAAIFEAAAEPILVLDLDGRVRRMNDAAGRVYPELREGSELSTLGDREAAEAVRRAAAGEIVRRERLVRQTAQGPATMTATLAPIRDHLGVVSALVETATSIEDALRAQKALHHADKMSTLGALAATLAHELANPLGCAMSNMEVLGDVDASGRVTGTDAREAALIVQEVRTSLEHCRDIIRRIREFASPNPGRREPVALAKVVCEAVKFAGPQLTRQAKVVVHVPDDLTSFGERTGMIQVLVNLLVNAAHALRGRTGGQVEVSGRADGSEVVLSVGDNGCGIAPHELPHIFDRFFTTKSAGEGTGLGLAVCRDVVRAHGGSIRVESEVGRGTRFEVRMPAWRPARPARVLVVDDDVMVLAATARLLRPHFEVLTATNAPEALAVLDSGSPRVDIILSDFVMPGQNGAELLRVVRERWPDVKRLVMTASLDPHAKMLIYERGQPIDVLMKPVEMMMLQSRLRAAMQ